MKTGKMRGFMCQSTAASAACMAGDPRSVVMPRRLDRIFLDETRLLNNNNDRYSKIVQSRRFNVQSAGKRPLVVGRPPVTKTDDHHQARQKPQPNPLPLPSSEHVFQVVVMRVALHCQGCAGKVKKHLSKMEGVTSFSIDLESKRVTVMGHVSPVGVLESISKVKRAEFWPC